MDSLSLWQYKDVVMKEVFVVRLTEAEQSELEALVRKGKASALTITRARILLKADQGKDGPAQTDAQIAEAVSIAAKTDFNVRQRWVEQGLEAALRRKKQAAPSRWRKLDGEACGCLLRPRSPRTSALDLTDAGRQTGGIGSGRVHQPGNGAPRAKKMRLSLG